MSFNLLAANFDQPPAALTSRARVLLAYVCYRASDAGEFWERLPRVAQHTGLSLPTVKRAIQELRKRRLLRLQRGGSGAVGRYVVDLETSINPDPSSPSTSINPDTGTSINPDPATSIRVDPATSINPDPSPSYRQLNRQRTNEGDKAHAREPASEKQIAYLRSLCGRAGVPFPATALSYDECSQRIDQVKSAIERVGLRDLNNAKAAARWLQGKGDHDRSPMPGIG